MQSLREVADQQNEMVIAIASVKEQIHSFIKPGNRNSEQIIAGIYGSMEVNKELEFILVNAVMNFIAGDNKRIEQFSKGLKLAQSMRNAAMQAPKAKTISLKKKTRK